MRLVQAIFGGLVFVAVVTMILGVLSGIYGNSNDLSKAPIIVGSGLFLLCLSAGVMVLAAIGETAETIKSLLDDLVDLRAEQNLKQSQGWEREAAAQRQKNQEEQRRARRTMHGD